MVELNIKDMVIKRMRLELVDLITPHVPALKECISYLNMYEHELEDLVKLPEVEQRRELKAIAHKVLTSYKREKDRGRSDK